MKGEERKYIFPGEDGSEMLEWVREIGKLPLPTLYGPASKEESPSQ